MSRGVRASEAVRGTTNMGLFPLFLLSFRYRDELSALGRRIGRQVIAARRADAVERRFIHSGAAIAVVDARGAVREGLAACQALTLTIASTGAAMLVLLSRRDTAVLDRFMEAGATHYMESPFDEAEFARQLRFADRFVERVAGGPRAASDRAALRQAESEAWMWTPGTRHVTLSPALAERVGAGREAISLPKLMRSIDREARHVANEAIARLLDTRQPTAFAHAWRGGADRIAHHLHLDEDKGVVIGWVENARDDAETRHLPRDPLTGLPPAEAIHGWVSEQLADGGASEPRCILMLLGVMRFGLVNAAFGRATGDALLQGVARRIERTIDQIGLRRFMIARTTGSEFAIAFAPPISGDGAELVAHRLVEAVSRPFVSGEALIPLSCRVGVATADPAGVGDTASLFRRAAAALAAIKHGETRFVEMLDAHGEAETVRRNRLEVDLRRALDQNQIDILFQPQVNIVTGEITGVEALARWQHPELGELGAVPLFATAARSDFVVQLSSHVLRRALELAAAWPEELAGLRLSVNLTAIDIAGPGFVTNFLALVDQTGFPRDRLTVEVTEGGLIEDLAGAAVMLAALRRAGLRVAIDDFGTGYSSLAYLKALPLDYLKIDKTLAEDITGSTRDRIVIRGVIDMARSLGLAVVTEGVETNAQLALLAREGCNYYQGFLCSPPISSTALRALVMSKAKAFDPAA
ncbi:MAG: diguanylate cyclase/phosphodiesterase [Rhizorhabdus sp.]|nr:diguanylate cyclase/phosphodiesterase [Rhizorhabdus sp.]